MSPPGRPPMAARPEPTVAPRRDVALTKREVIHRVLAHERPPYVPWSFGFTLEAREKLEDHFGHLDLDRLLHAHLVWAGDPAGAFTNLGGDFYRDPFGVVWDRHRSKSVV